MTRFENMKFHKTTKFCLCMGKKVQKSMKNSEKTAENYKKNFKVAFEECKKHIKNRDLLLFR